MTLPQRELASTLLAVGVLLVSMGSSTIGASIATGLFGAVGPTGAAALRLAFGTAVLLAVFRPWRLPPTSAAWRAILRYGVALGTMNVLFYIALATVPLGLAVTLEFIGPLAVAMMGSRRALDFLWTLLALAGLLVILHPLDSSGSALDPTGVGCALGAGVCWGLYIVFGRRAGAVHGMQTTAVGMVVAAAIAVPIGTVEAGAALWSSRILVAGAVVGVLGTALPYTLEMIALRRLSARVFGTLMSLGPAVAALVGALMLHQRLTLLQCEGIAAVVVASTGATATIRSRAPVRSAPASNSGPGR